MKYENIKVLNTTQYHFSIFPMIINNIHEVVMPAQNRRF